MPKIKLNTGNIIEVDESFFNLDDLQQQAFLRNVVSQIETEQPEPEIKYAPSPEKTLREKIATGARAAQLGSIALPGLLGTPVSSVGRVVEGLAEGETTPQALKAGATSAAFDIATAGIGKYAKAFKQARKARKAQKGGISQTEFESAKDVLDRNKQLFSGRKKVPTSKLADPNYVNVVGDKTGDTIDALKKTIMSKQKNAIAKGDIPLNQLPADKYKKLTDKFKDIDLDPDVTTPKTYKKILEILGDPNITAEKLYEARRLADEAINPNETKVFQKPYTTIRRKINEILRDPDFNTKAKEYGKETDNLKSLLETKSVANLVRKTDPGKGTGKFGEGYIAAGQSNQKELKDIIKKLKIEGKLQKDLQKDIIEGLESVETSKAFRDIKVPTIIGDIPVLGRTLTQAYKSTLPLQQRAKEQLPFAISRLYAREAPQRQETGQLTPQTTQQIKQERRIK
jgi:hypothetical protein